LEHWQRSTTIAAGLARRGKIILLLAGGNSQSEVGRTVGVQRTVVRKWAKRFLAQRLEGLADAPGRGAKQPRDAAFYATVSELIDLYTRLLRPDELVLSVDEKTSLQPRPRRRPTLPAQPHNLPNRVEHEYTRAGALNLFAAFDTRSGKVYGYCYERKRQREFIAFLERLDAEIDQGIHTIHLMCDNVSTHHGKEVRKWIAPHPRFVFHFTPVHCSWMNQVEQWFSILQRKRLRIVDFESKDHLRVKLEQFIREWNQQAHPFNWSTKSVAKVMAAAPAVAA
jgi:transposase